MTLAIGEDGAALGYAASGYSAAIVAAVAEGTPNAAAIVGS